MKAADVKSLVRGFDLLELLAKHPDGLTLSEVCRMLPMPKSSAHALLHTLQARNYLTSGRRERTYRLGPGIFQLGNAYLSGIDLLGEGQEVVRELARKCDETVHLATLDGRDVLYVVKEEGSSTMRMVSAVGKRFPAHGTGVGKMLVSALTDAEFEKQYPPDRPPEQLTSATISDIDELRTELARTRARGYALDNEESTVGLCCVAAPVFDTSSRMVAAMSIAIPIPRFTPERQEELLALVLQGTNRLSERLGYVRKKRGGDEVQP